MWTFKKAPFRRGQLVSNGEVRKIVNRIFEAPDGQWGMLVGGFYWHNSLRHMVEFCEEVPCAGWYAI